MSIRKQNPIYSTRDYQAGDEAAISALFSTVFGADLTEAHWQWKYAGLQLTPPIARLAFDRHGQLHGHAGAVALRGWRHGEPLMFLQICDVMVHPEARGQLGTRNLFTRLARELLAGIAERWADAFAYGFPGQRPFRLGKYAQVYANIEVAQRLYRPPAKHLFSMLGIHALDWQDPRLDQLWQRLAVHLSLAVIRDRAYLHWRYARHPKNRYQLFGVHLAGRLLGWAVIQIVDTTVRVIDLLIAPYWLKPALWAVERQAYKLGASAIEIWLPANRYTSRYQATEATQVVVTHMVWRPAIATATVQKELYYTMGDLDIF